MTDLYNNESDKSQYAPVIQELNLQQITRQSVESLDLLKLHELNPERYPFFLESVAKGCTIHGGQQGENLGQFDILFAFPQETLQLRSGDDSENFVESLQALFSKQRLHDSVSINWPFFGGWFAYFSYDYAQVVEPVLNLPQSNFPLAHLTRVPAAVMINHDTKQAAILVEPGYEKCLNQIEADLETVFAKKPEQASVKSVDLINTSEEPESKYLNGVEEIKEYILCGDIFQVNLSREWQVEISEQNNHIDLYRALRKSNPAPFAALAHFHDPETEQAWQIISSSPERLVKYQHPWVETRPIAGTRKRGETEKADQALVKELIDHPKERAEHIMLIDLERNDLGRICQPGTVEVNELMVVETYEHVHHIVSNVRGKLREGFSPLDIVHALFPGGTITGCPKVRCMEIIAELEQMPREAYTGSLGYINLDGSLDLNILIRTMLHYQQNNKSIVSFRAGAGIVADSDPEFELTESRHKAKGLIKAFSEVNS